MTVAALRRWVSEIDGKSGARLYLWCPACEGTHAVEVEDPSAARWEWDGNLDAPTVSPSIKVTSVQWEEGSPFHRANHHVAVGEATTCHSFVRAGRWEFGADSTHSLAGQTVPLPPLPDWVTTD